MFTRFSPKLILYHESIWLMKFTLIIFVLKYTELHIVQRRIGKRENKYICIVLDNWSDQIYFKSNTKIVNWMVFIDITYRFWQWIDIIKLDAIPFHSIFQFCIMIFGPDIYLKKKQFTFCFVYRKNLIFLNIFIRYFYFSIQN